MQHAKSLTLIFFTIFLVSCSGSDNNSNDSVIKPDTLKSGIENNTKSSDTPISVPKSDTPKATPKSDTPTPTPKSDTPKSTPKSDTPTPTPKSDTPTPTPKSDTSTPTPKSDTPTPSINNADDLMKFISTQIINASHAGTLKKLDANELCSNAPTLSKNMCIQKTLMDIQAATKMNSNIPTKVPSSQSMKGSKSRADLNSDNPCANVPAVAKDECLKGIAQAKKDNEGSEAWDKLKYADSYDPANPPKIAKYNFTEIEKFSKISKIRSGVGHNYTPSTDEHDPTNKNCKSMKHYLIPVGVPNSSDLYAKTAHTFKWLSIKYFSPVDGYIVGVSYKQNSYGTESNFKIVSKNNPGFYFGYFHAALADGLKEGSEVKAGQQIGTFGDENTYGEIAVEVQVKNGKTYALSFLEVANESVFKEFSDEGINSANDVIITREYRDANPLACDNSEAGWFIGSSRSGVLDMNFERWQFESGDNWFFFEN
jgi:outer membrane biosynthesis protein TonB